MMSSLTAERKKLMWRKLHLTPLRLTARQPMQITEMSPAYGEAMEAMRDFMLMQAAHNGIQRESY